jgi:twitching motility protein PilI
MNDHDSDFAPGAVIAKPDPGARRTRLREFQARLVERMQAARSGEQQHASQLGVVIGQNRWLLDLQEAGEIISVGAIAKVPLTQSWFLGLITNRGNLISVVDFAAYLGEPATHIDKECRIVSLAPSLSFNSGLLVSRIMGLRNMAGMQPRPAPQDSSPPWLRNRYLDQDGQVWTELSLSAIIQEPQFLHVGL